MANNNIGNSSSSDHEDSELSGPLEARLEALLIGMQKPVDIMEAETEKVIMSMCQQRDELEARAEWLADMSQMIEDVSSHPRVSCRPLMSKYVEIDCLLSTSEYRLKHAEFSVVSSLKMTSTYCQKSIEEMHDLIHILNDRIAKLNDQQRLAKGATGGNVIEVHRDGNNTITVYENGLVDIVELENVDNPEPYVRPVRAPRFKTIAERDLFVKQQQECARVTKPEEDPHKVEHLVGGDEGPSRRGVSMRGESAFCETADKEQDLQLRLFALKEALSSMKFDADTFGAKLGDYQNQNEESARINALIPDDEALLRQKTELCNKIDEIERAMELVMHQTQDYTKNIHALEDLIEKFRESRHLMFNEHHRLQANEETNSEVGDEDETLRRKRIQFFDTEKILLNLINTL